LLCNFSDPFTKYTALLCYYVYTLSIDFLHCWAAEGIINIMSFSVKYDGALKKLATKIISSSFASSLKIIAHQKQLTGILNVWYECKNVAEVIK
jgi:hypothetical protein